VKKHSLIFLLLLLVSVCYGQIDATARYTVYIFIGEDCKICQYYAPQLNELYETFHSDSLDFVGLFPNRYSNKKGIEAYKEKHQIDFELKMEYFATKTKKFGVEITPDVVVYDQQLDTVLYKGRIDNSYYKLGRRRQVVTTSELEDVLNQIQIGEKVSVVGEPSIGCYITFRK